MRAMGLQPKKGEVEAMIAEVDADRHDICAIVSVLSDHALCSHDIWTQY